MESLVDYSLITNEIKLVNRRVKGDSFKIAPQINRRIEKVDDSRSAVTYVLEIKDSPENPFPLEILVSITGIFNVSKLEKEAIDDFLEVQTCQILFPHIRAIVANLTATALMQPILLPVVDARKLFSDKQKEDTKVDF